MRTTVTSLSVPKNTRCKTHSLCVNPGVPFWTCEKTQRNTRWRHGRSLGETKYSNSMYPTWWFLFSIWSGRCTCNFPLKTSVSVTHLENIYQNWTSWPAPTMCLLQVTLHFPYGLTWSPGLIPYNETLPSSVHVSMLQVPCLYMHTSILNFSSFWQWRSTLSFKMLC